MIYILILCIIIIGFLGFKLLRKQTLDKTALEEYREEISDAKRELQDLLVKKQEARNETDYERYKLSECRKDLQAALDVY